MPQQIYTVELDGKHYDLEGDHPPTEAEARAAIGAMKPVASHESSAPERTWTDTAVDLLPTAGGVVGGLAMSELGPVGAAVGAGGGGMVGERVKQYVNALRGKEALPSQGEAVSRMGGEGLTQAGAEVGGRVIGAGLRTVAKPLYQSVLKPSKALRKEFPTLVQTALDQGIPVSRGGAEKAGELVDASKGAADQLVADRQAFLQRLGPQVATVDPRQAVTGITSAIQDVRQLPVARPQMQAIGEYGRQYLREHPQPISLTDAQASVRATDRFYDKAYRASMDKGNPTTAGNTAAALGINNETRHMLRSRVPGLQAQNANTRAIEGVRQAVSERADQQGNLSRVGMQHLINAGLGSGAGAIGGPQAGVGTFALLEALTNPATASRLAIAAQRGGSDAASAQAMRQALLSLMVSHGQEDQ